MNSAIAAIIGLAVSIYLIVKKVSPVYSLIAGALVGGLLSGWGLVTTVNHMISGVKDIVPAILRILAAGILSGALIKTGAAKSIAQGIVNGLGTKQVYLALALSAMILTGVGVFIDVAVITVAPIAISLATKLRLSPAKLLMAMIGGGKCGNIMSPNPNTIAAAENYNAPLTSVMAAGIVPALIGLIVVVFVIIPLMPSPKKELVPEVAGSGNDDCPPFLGSIAGPLAAILLMALRPIFGIVIDPVVALPVGGFVTLICTRRLKDTGIAISYGLEKMSGVAILLIGTGTIAGIIKASCITQLLVDLLSGSSMGTTLMAPISSILMSAATASSTAGATIASSSFAPTILAAGVSSVWAAAMTNAGATVLDTLPFGSFFHATGGSMEMPFGNRLFLIPFEALTGLVLTLCSVSMYLLLG